MSIKLKCYSSLLALSPVLMEGLLCLVTTVPRKARMLSLLDLVLCSIL